MSEIRISAKWGKKDGSFEFKIRENGTIVKHWNGVANKRGASLAPLLASLRVKHEDSIKLSLEIPVVFANNAKGAKHIFIDHARLPYYLNLHQSDMIDLREAGLIQPEPKAKIRKMRIDYPALAREYSRRLQSGEFSTRADLARSIGVSRAWISKVMNLKRKTG